jgi:hypothetical protein
VSHKEVEIVDEFLKQLDDEIGKETPINKAKEKFIIIWEWFWITLNMDVLKSI